MVVKGEDENSEWRQEPNTLGETPVAYLTSVRSKLQDNLRFIKSRSVGGYSGLNPMVGTTDSKGGSYNETASQHGLNSVCYRALAGSLLKAIFKYSFSKNPH